ncbi:MAG: hypothetical protein K2N29_03500, partial [Ruminiclostridium sp.]|nr:hypothetical protein [Ruminiclostridium sp.]
MAKKISKKFIIVMSAFVAVVLLSAWSIVSGTAASVIQTVKFELWELFNPPTELDLHLLDDLKPGKYLLERTWGLDETDYIEVFDDHTVQFVGEHWNNLEADEKERFGDSYDEFVHLNERNPYTMHEMIQAVLFGEKSAVEGGEGFSYVDENTF